MIASSDKLIALITYPVPHAKTQEIFFSFLRRDVRICFVITDFQKRPDRSSLFQHRPDQFTGVAPAKLAEAFGIKIFAVNDWDRIVDGIKYGVVCGSNLLPANVVRSSKIVNSHPGIIPLVRGLDAFKWAIHDLQPVGNTLHIIDEEADSGRVFHIAETPVFSSDDLQSFAQRHYRAELDLLCNFQHFLGQERSCLAYESRPARKRMNVATEQSMMQQFNEFKRKFQKT